MGGAEKRATLGVISLRLSLMGAQKLQASSHRRISNRAIIGLRKRRYLRRDSLGHPRAPIFHLPFRRAVCSAEVRIRCECCSAACKLASLSTFGYLVQRKSIADAVSEDFEVRTTNISRIGGAGVKIGISAQ